jgi:integrase
VNAANRGGDDIGEVEGDVLPPRDLVLTNDLDGPAPSLALPPDAIARARGYASASRAASTRAKYEAAWDSFAQWCSAHGHESLPAHPGTVAVFLAEEAARGCSPSWVNLKMAAIGWVHRRAGKLAPHKVAEGGVAILDVLAGIRREHGRPPDRKQAACGDVVRDVLRAIEGEALRCVRDRALLAFGLASCLRRSELVALRLDDLTRVPEGLRVRITRSKTDQEGKGAVIAVPEGRRLRPVAHLDTWIERASITEGFLFRGLSRAGTRALAAPMSDRAIARVVQARVAAAGYDPALFAGHSLRAGFLTSAARAGASVFKMQEQSRHKSIQVLSTYVRDAHIFHDHAGKDFL